MANFRFIRPLLVGTILSLLFFSCKTTEESFSYKETTARYLQPSMSGYITPTVADLNVSSAKISHSETFENTIKDASLASSPELEYMKNYTLAQAVVINNADVLVGHIFDVKTQKKGEEVVVTVTGYPATYVNFRKATDDDLKLMDGATPKLNVRTPEGNEVNPKMMEKKKAKDIKLPIRVGWHHAINLTFGSISKGKDLGIRYEAGYRFNQVVLLGFGAGYHYGFVGMHNIPVFAHLKIYMIGYKRVNPFIALSQGIDISIRPENKLVGIGSFTRGEVGLNFRVKNLDIPISFEVGTSPYLNPKTTPKVSHSIYYGVKVGISF